MREWEQEVLQQYDIDVKNMKKVRDGILCEGSQGVYLITHARSSEKRLEAIHHLQMHLRKHGLEEVDELQRNQEGQLSCELEDGERFLMKRWFSGRECDLSKESEILCAVKKLASLHLIMSRPIDWEGYSLRQGEDLFRLFDRRNRELKKTRSFMRAKVGKNEFESLYLKNFESLYDLAQEATEHLKNLDYARIKKGLVHGDYNYHNILVIQNKMTVVNYEHFEENLQIMDLYYLLRKVMEKHHWDANLGEKMISTYAKIRTISEKELSCLAVCVAYPEKFWKAANSYSRANKAWIPAKNVEKLQLVTRQVEEKTTFLEKVLEKH